MGKSKEPPSIYPNVDRLLQLANYMKVKTEINCANELTTGAYELPKAVKEHGTYTACQVPSQSKSIAD